MKLFTNKFPVLSGFVMVEKDGSLNTSGLDVVVDEGKVFKMIGATQMDVVLECEKKALHIQSSTVL